MWLTEGLLVVETFLKCWRAVLADAEIFGGYVDQLA
jgi:hypothetical protein